MTHDPLTQTRSPLVPPAPRMPKRRKRRGDYRWAVWPVALVIGVALGIVGYRYVPDVAFYFDYWVAVALS